MDGKAEFGGQIEFRHDRKELYEALGLKKAEADAVVDRVLNHIEKYDKLSEVMERILSSRWKIEKKIFAVFVLGKLLGIAQPFAVVARALGGGSDKV